MPSISLMPWDIQLWLVWYEDIDTEEQELAYRDLLSCNERKQEKRFKFEKDRFRYLVTRALTRTVLSRYVPVCPTEWRFQANLYGRPEAANEEAKDAGLVFNISHTDQLIVLGVTKRRSLGVDVERLQPTDFSMDVAEKYFSTREVTDLMALSQNERSYRFFEYWTLKESYIKARGMGLSLPLDQFGFFFHEDRSIAVEFESRLEDCPTQWQFWQFQPTDEHLVAICSTRVSETPTRIVVRRAVPLERGETIISEFV